MRDLLNSMKAQASLSVNDRTHARMGIVSGYDPATHSAKVILQPDEVETGWIPVSSPMVGDGWGLFSPPSPGEMVAVHFQEGGIDAGYVAGRFWSNADRPTIDVAGDPTGCPAGEFWLIHKSGSALKFGNDGGVTIVAHTAINSSAPAWNHTGPLNLDGTLTATGDVIANGEGGISLIHHKHGDTQPGSGETGEPVT